MLHTYIIDGKQNEVHASMLVIILNTIVFFYRLGKWIDSQCDRLTVQRNTACE